MSLATRCPACGTVFRVVQDQLRVSEGWVRCGRCSEVFNAVEQLVELPAQAPRPQPVAEPPPAAADPSPDTAPAIALGRSADIEIEPELPAPAAPAAAESVDLPITIDDDDRRGVAPPAAVSAAVSAAVTAAVTTTVSPTDSPRDAAEWTPSSTALEDTTLAGTAPAPSFLREQARDNPWSRPLARRTLTLAALVMVLLLALQVAVEYRNLIAARWPAAAPALHAVCAWSGCRIDPPRWIEAIVVDSSGLVRVEGTQTYRFSVMLRNRSAMALAMPAIDLTLTDLRGQVIARRVLQAADLGVATVAVPALAELPMQATLAVAAAGGAAVSGYTIEFFYP